MKDLKSVLEEKTASLKSMKRRSKLQKTLATDKSIILKADRKKLPAGSAIVPLKMIQDKDLNVNGREVYLQLRSAAGWKDITNLAIPTIAARSGKGVRTVKRALYSLRDRGYIWIIKVKNESNVYIIIADIENREARVEYLLSFTPIQLWNACIPKDKYHKHKAPKHSIP